MATFTVDVDLNGTAVESKTLEGVTVRYGRQSVYQQPEPTTCSVTLVREALGTVNLVDIQVGTTVEVTVTPTGQSALRRFYGVVTDISADKDTVRLDCTSTGVYSLRQLTTVDTLGPPLILDNYSPVDLLVGLYEQALDQLGYDYGAGKPARFPDIYGSDYPLETWPILPLGARYENAEIVPLRNVVETALPCIIGGVLFEVMRKVSGRTNIALVLKNAADRLNASTVVTLTDTEVANDWDAFVDLGQFATITTVRYQGPYDFVAGAFNAPGSVTVTSAQYGADGPFTEVLDTNIYDGTSALSLATYRNGWSENPGPTLEFTVPLAALADARARDIAYYSEVSRLWELPPLADGLTTHWFVEGYTERIARHDWTLRMRCSDWVNSGRGQQWDEVTAGLQWQATDPTVRWIDVRWEDL